MRHFKPRDPNRRRHAVRQPVTPNNTPGNVFTDYDHDRDHPRGRGQSRVPTPVAVYFEISHAPNPDDPRLAETRTGKSLDWIRGVLRVMKLQGLVARDPSGVRPYQQSVRPE